ncbi:unnamed protein product [Amoebophrya sp. A120]|nr:unnamed protein product [Amoebophrya sp. A120]|eukprot:GSA120T00012767001.1
MTRLVHLLATTASSWAFLPHTADGFVTRRLPPKLVQVENKKASIQQRKRRDEKAKRKQKDPYSPMTRLGMEDKAKPDPALENIPGPAARLGLDVKPRPMYKEAEEVKHYEFEAIPTDPRPPLKLRDVEAHVAPAFGIFKGLALGSLFLIPMYLWYVWRHTENGARNVTIVVGVFTAIGLLCFMLQRMGVFDRMWEKYASHLGEKWLEGFLLVPVGLFAFLMLADLTVRGQYSAIGKVVAKIPTPPSIPVKTNSLEGFMSSFL